MIGAIGRYIAHDQSAHRQLLISMKDGLDITGKDAGLQTIIGIIDERERFIEVIISGHRNDGSKNLLTIYPHLGIGICQHSGRQQSAIATAAAEQVGAVVDRLFYPTLGAHRLSFADHGTDRKSTRLNSS